jgi:hypothetical protein
MATEHLEVRVAALEAELARLKKQVEPASTPSKAWWREIGTFEDDPIYDEAMRLGAEYRRSLRPKSAKRGRKRNGRPRHRSS